MEINLGKALAILDQIVEGRNPKEIAFNFKVNPCDVTRVKKMFPLFAGLTRPYKARTEAQD